MIWFKEKKAAESSRQTRKLGLAYLDEVFPSVLHSSSKTENIVQTPCLFFGFQERWSLHWGKIHLAQPRTSKNVQRLLNM